MFGRTKKAAKKAVTKKKTGPKNRSDKKGPAKSSQSTEAKAILAKMQAKKDAGDCPFC